MLRVIRLLAGVMFLLPVSQLHAAVITVSDTVTGFADAGANPPNPFSITFSALPTQSVAGGTLNLVTFGDFDSPMEYIDVTIDGVSFGRLWDSNPLNDQFNGTIADNDIGRQYNAPTGNPAANLTLSKAVLDGILADGTFLIGFSFGPTVSNVFNTPNEFITATLTYESASVAAVPEPASVVAFGLLACCAGLQMRRPRA